MGKGLNEEASVFQAEVTVIQKAVEVVAPQVGKSDKLHVCSDSLADIHSLVNPVCSSQTVLECKSVIARHSVNKEVCLHWVQAQNGHMLN